MLFSDFKVRLVDVSQFQDDPATAYKPTLDKLQSAGINGFIVRVGYGLVEDRDFTWFWGESKGKFRRKPYWYGDYYSHRGTLTTDAEWGDIQADTCWSLIKDDPGDMPVALDCEASSYGGAIGLHRTSFNTIMKSFCESLDALSGKKTEIYTSPSLLQYFDDWAKDRDLWIAWYNETITYQQILDKVKLYGWRGKVILWQYASDGDINEDGIADGLAMGMESNGLDLNVYLGTDWNTYSGGDIVMTDPILEPGVLFQAKCIRPEGVDTRNEFNVDIKMDLHLGDVVNVYEIGAADSKVAGFWRIDPKIQRWVTNSPNFMQKLGETPSIDVNALMTRIDELATKVASMQTVLDTLYTWYEHKA